MTNNLFQNLFLQKSIRPVRIRLESNKILKCLYFEENPKDTLLYHMLEKVDFSDRIVVVGGYKYDDLEIGSAHV